MSPSPPKEDDPVDAKGAKKRTKTGCLTCRKRRIKCGEEKPVCRNCIKSRRECAGYVQPLVYKQQSPGSPLEGHDPGQRILSNQDGIVAPGGFSTLGLHPEQQYLGSYPGFDPSIPQPYQQLPFRASYHAYPPQSTSDSYTNPLQVESLPEWQNTQNLTGQAGPSAFDPAARGISTIPLQMGQAATYANGAFPVDPQLLHYPGHLGPRSISAHSQPPLSGPGLPQDNYGYGPRHPNSVQAPQRSSTMSQQRNVSQKGIEDHASRRHGAGGFVPHPNFYPTAPGGTMPAGKISDISIADDDYDDPEDPFDVDMVEQDLSFKDAAENLTEILDPSGQRRRRAPTTSASQRPQHHPVAAFRAMTATPLQDERNEHIFYHFVEVTSQCISLYERHHFTSLAGPARTLWNFTIPSLALSHPALAHAILALGALHLAKLQNTSEDPAIKHFTYAVRRVGKLVGLPKRRHEIATLATVLVLGFYEVMSGDHSRWSLHLSGATKLVLEHDYAGLIRTARRMRNGAKARVNQWMAQFALTEENYARVAGIPLALLDDIDWEVDTAFISQLTGLSVDYDNQVQPGFDSPINAPDLTEKDIEELKAKMDLRWWYCKQDIFQSMVGGDRLLMPFENWKFCPPRGQFGRSANPYATMDHLAYIMARVADFGGKDRPRKQRAVAAQGGQWRPPTWLFGPQGTAGPRSPGSKRTSGTPSRSPSTNPGSSGASLGSVGQNLPKPSPAPSANEGRVRQSKPGLQNQGPTGGPPMFGMMPPPQGPVELHSAFKTMDASIKDPAFAAKKGEKSPPASASLEEETAKALAEHAEITKAFDLFSKSLGADFEPLSNSDSPIATPFGPALVFRNVGIASIWAFYNVGRILLHRLHPEMPPAAMVSAGVTAHLTREYAQKVGKICAGLYSNQRYVYGGALDPAFAGALMESSFSLLFAGVQYTDAGQRGWTISKLQDIGRRCGWQTSNSISAACEITWERMGEAGRGPPYERTLDANAHDVRVNGAFQRSSTETTPTDNPSDPVADYESEFVKHDRSLIDRSGSSRIHWALGLLSVEEDIQKMRMDEN